jgi:hypothetical protein
MVGVGDPEEVFASNLVRRDNAMTIE